MKSGATTVASTQYTASAANGSSDLSAAFAVRMRVFVEEQGVPPDEEMDAYDVTAMHFVVRAAGNDGKIVATARLVEKETGVGKIGRVAVLSEHRGAGVGTLLMIAVEDAARKLGITTLVLESQCHAIPFYERLGYSAHGDVFLDAGIEHRLMDRKL